MEYYFEVSVRKQSGRWIVLAVSPLGNTEAVKDTLTEALHEAAKVYERERIRYGSNHTGIVPR